MNDRHESGSGGSPAAGRPDGRLAVNLLLGAATYAGLAALAFWLAGSFRWTRGWACVGLLTALHGTSGLYLWKTAPELLRRRGVMGEGTKAWDKVLLGLFGLAYLAIWIVAALDRRWGGSHMPACLWPAGAVLYAAFVAVLTWSMRVNPHFEKFVRIQHDRGHRVIASGPYRYLRHPGYAGTLVGFALGMPLLLGSWAALVPAAASAVVLVVRTGLEDRTLRKELPGYREYAKRVRYLLVPGIW